MKNENLIYGLGSLLATAGALMKIFHLPYGNSIFLFGIIGLTLFQSWLVSNLKKRIKELETKTQ